MLRSLPTLGLAAVLSVACGTPKPPAAPQPVKVFATAATYPWLDRVYSCASASSIIVQLSTPAKADLLLRFGEPEGLAMPAFQIGRDDLLVVVQPQTGVGPLTLEQVRALFSGQVMQWKTIGGADIPVQLWSYAPSEDIQTVFERQVMQNQPVGSLARLAVSAQAMSDAVGADPGSIGFLPRRWKTGNTNIVLTVPSIPVLALTPAEPQGSAKSLAGCLQSSD